MDGTPAPTRPSRRYGLIFWVCTVVGALLSIVKAWAWSNHEWTGEAQGYALGGIVLPGLIAYAFAGRRKVRNPNLFGLWFCGLCLLFFLLELSQHYRN